MATGSSSSEPRTDCSASRSCGGILPCEMGTVATRPTSPGTTEPLVVRPGNRWAIHRPITAERPAGADAGATFPASGDPHARDPVLASPARRGPQPVDALLVRHPFLGLGGLGRALLQLIP